VIDYLEQAEEERSDALWEAVRCLDAALAVGTGQKDQAAPQEEAVEADEAETRAPADNTGAPTSELPLLAAVRDVEEAARWLETAGRTGRGAEESGTGSTWRAALPDGAGQTTAERSGAWSAAEAAAYRRAVSWSGRSADQGEAAIQAQQLDQIFRRDSRRYDGGFFLY
jgi:hypothetical protein